MSEEAKSNVLRGRFRTTNNIPIDTVRECAEESCEKLICIGVDKDGKMFQSASFSDGQLMLWLIEQFKVKLLLGGFGE